MSNVSTEQLAELLVGIARAQYAVIEAMDRARPGFRQTYVDPVLQTAARVREFNRQQTLADFPARVLLDCQRRGGPDVGNIARELERLLATDDGGSLDMTKG